MLTVEQLTNGAVLAHCHSASYADPTDFALRVDLWREGVMSETWA